MVDMNKLFPMFEVSQYKKETTFHIQVLDSLQRSIYGYHSTYTVIEEGFETYRSAHERMLKLEKLYLKQGNLDEQR